MMMPSFVSAAWWNPISWFRKTDTRDTKIEVVENKINVGAVATPTESNKAISPTKNIETVEIKKEARTTIKSDTSNSSTIQAEIQKQILDLKQQLEILDTKLKDENQARIDAIKKQQAIDRANEEARDAQLRNDAQTQEAQEKLDEENRLVAKIESQIASYIQNINIRISGGESSSVSSPTTATGCQGIKTGNGCKASQTTSYSVDIRGNIRAQLANRRSELVAIQGRLKEKGSGGITENDRKFLNSLGISW